MSGSASARPEKSNNAPKNKKTGKDHGKKKSKKPKDKTPGAPPKKTFKATIRKLPVQGYKEEDFRAGVEKICEKLTALNAESAGVSKDPPIVVEHFVEGKLR
jgi:hypothetical protein